VSIELNAAAIFDVLERHRIAYVLIGGYAAQLHGASKPTSDADIVPATDRDNLERLAGALRELGARIRTHAVPDGLPFDTSADALAGTLTLNLQTRYGDLDITFTPDGTTGYEDLVRGSTPVPVANLTIQLASLDDIIRSKTAAGRDKDIAALPELVQLNRTTPPEH
jgi:hypothetical protein